MENLHHFNSAVFPSDLSAILGSSDWHVVYVLNFIEIFVSYVFDEEPFYSEKSFPFVVSPPKGEVLVRVVFGSDSSNADELSAFNDTKK